MKKLIFIALLLLQASPALAWEKLRHYDIPEQCTVEALADIKISVIEVGKLFYVEDGKRYEAYGQWVDKTAAHYIKIVRGMPDWLVEEVLEHERCHELIWQLTGDGRWHGLKESD